MNYNAELSQMDKTAYIKSGAEILCLDHGFVRYVDHMGDDGAIVQAARVSYGKGTKTPSEDQALINYLLRHKHETPFEMCELKLHCKMPIFVARQWIRHRTASVNEYSARYSEVKDEFYVPEYEQIQPQSKTNKQGREVTSEEFDLVQADFALCAHDAGNHAKFHYQQFNERGLSREINRIIMPVSNYTEWYWKCDLRNLFNFLRLRMDSHAQYEIRVFANVIGEIVKTLWPMAWEAFEEYVLHAQTFSRKEMAIIRAAVNRDLAADMKTQPTDFSPGEWKEFLKKLT